MLGNLCFGAGGPEHTQVDRGGSRTSSRAATVKETGGEAQRGESPDSGQSGRVADERIHTQGSPGGLDTTTRVLGKVDRSRRRVSGRRASGRRFTGKSEGRRAQEKRGAGRNGEVAISRDETERASSRHNTPQLNPACSVELNSGKVRGAGYGFGILSFIRPERIMKAEV